MMEDEEQTSIFAKAIDAAVEVAVAEDVKKEEHLASLMAYYATVHPGADWIERRKVQDAAWRMLCAFDDLGVAIKQSRSNGK